MIILYLFRLPCLHWVALDLGDGKPKKFVSLFFITSDDTYSRTPITCTLKANKKKMIKLEKFEF